MPTATVGEVQLYYEIHGEGAPLMLIAGLASDSQSWQPVLNDLAAHHLVISPDNRGVGRTIPQDVESSVQHIASDCMGLLRHLGLSSVNLLGHSLGGFVALDMAVRYPQYIDKLILAATAPSNSERNNALFARWALDRSAGMDMAAWFRGIFPWLFTSNFMADDEKVAEAVRLAVEYPYPQSHVAFRRQVEAIAAFDASKELPRISAKTLVLGGREDLLYPPEVSVALAQGIPGASLKLIDEAAHSIHMEQAAAFGRHVIDFLSNSSTEVVARE
jgi:pimeloyl-ACP methyl ester carboxylesterase